MKFYLIAAPCVLLGSAGEFVYKGFTEGQINWIIFGFLLGVATAFTAGFSFCNKTCIIKPHNPNQPFTSQEFSQMNIHLLDPERYDCEMFVR